MEIWRSIAYHREKVYRCTSNQNGASGRLGFSESRIEHTRGMVYIPQTSLQFDGELR